MARVIGEDIMSNERLKVLELIREGKITPEEGLELLNVLQSTDDSHEQGEELKIELGDTNTEGNIAKNLRIRIDKANGKNFDVTLPASLVKFFGGLGHTHIKANGEHIDIDQWWEKQEAGYKGVLFETTSKSGKDIKIELF